MGMDPTEKNYPANLSVEDLALLLGHASTDAIRKRWEQFEFDVLFASNLVLTEDQVRKIVGIYAGKRNEAALKMLGGSSFRALERNSSVRLPKPPPPSKPDTDAVRPLADNNAVRPLADNNAVRPLADNNAVRPLDNNAVRPLADNNTVLGIARRYWSAILQSVAVVVLVISSVISVGEIIREVSPIGYWAYVVSTVICTAPVLLLSAGSKLDPWLAYSTMGITLVIEIFCNAVAINRHTTAQFINQVNHTSSFDDITLAWSLGIGLPVMALLFEISLLRIIKKS